jgi:hypothetical protein
MVALDALSHPLSVGATGLLILNDHVLKSAMPGLVTGKLSDFAGLFFFPFLATFALSFLSVRRPDVVGFVGTAVWFLGMKLLPGIARATESMFPCGITSTHIRSATYGEGKFAVLSCSGLRPWQPWPHSRISHRRWVD